MQFPVTDAAALAFARGFYQALARSNPVDEAVRIGRIAIDGTGEHTLEWVTPVLYLRTDDTRLFAVHPTNVSVANAESSTSERVVHEARPQQDTLVSETEQRDTSERLSTSQQEVTGDARWAEGLSAFFAGRYEEAVERFEALQVRYPDDARLQPRLDRARRQRDLAAWSDDADTAAKHGDWASAIEVFERIVAIDATYRSASARLEQARTAQRRQLLLDEISALHQAGQWQAVLAAGEELVRLDPSDHDPGGMLAYARQQVADANLATRYDEGLRRLDQEQWQDAADLFAAIERERPGYRDSATLLVVAQQHLPQPETLNVGQSVRCLAFNPDGTRLATGSGRWVRVWDSRTRRKLWDAKIGSWLNDVICIAFSPDGTRLATACEDNTARVWDAANGAELLTVKHANWVDSVAFSPDGTRLATGSRDKTVRITPIP